MRIDIVCSSGSPIGVTPLMVEDKGVGGAELALICLTEALGRRGHVVTVYNNPTVPGTHGSVIYDNLTSFVPSQSRDAVVIFRTPYSRLQQSVGKKVFWSCDQKTCGSYPVDIFPYVNKIVVISPFHYKFFKEFYNAPEDKMEVIGLGVRAEDYSQGVGKVPYQCIFCSVPDRGLPILRKCWDRILKQVPEATLVITSDYRLWGVNSPGNHTHRLEWAGVPGINFLGKVPRSQLVHLQKQSVLQTYPCTYDELFCISVAECQVAGAVPITTTRGAVDTTNMYGIRIPGDPTSLRWQDEFVEQVIVHLRNNELTNGLREMGERTIRNIFNWDLIAQVWEGLLS